MAWVVMMIVCGSGVALAYTCVMLQPGGTPLMSSPGSNRCQECCLSTLIEAILGVSRTTCVFVSIVATDNYLLHLIAVALFVEGHIVQLLVLASPRACEISVFPHFSRRGKDAHCSLNFTAN